MKLRRIVSIVFICVFIHINLCWGQLDKFKLCEIVNEIIKSQTIDLSFESKFVGKCKAGVLENLPAELRFESGDHQCKTMDQIVILSDEMFFVENVKYAIQIEKVKMKENKIKVNYSIVEFFHNKKKGENKNTFSKGRVFLDRRR